jgi:plastocyanin
MKKPIAVAGLLFSLLAVSLAAFACGGGGSDSPTSPPPPSGGVVVEIRDFEFVPKSITVSPGDTVTWRLTGSANIGHNVNASGGAFASGAVFTSAGAQFSHTFTDADLGKTFPYYCTTHQVCCVMQGSIRVGDSAPPPAPGY